MKVDLIIHAGWIIPVIPSGVTHESHCLIINKGKILDLIPSHQAELHYQASEEKWLENHVLIPGLINGHTHTGMSLLRGYADDYPLMDWLNHHIWPVEQKFMSESFVRSGSRLAIAEMIRAGITCFNDMYFFPEITASESIKSGIRANIGLIVIDFPSAWANSANDYIDKGLNLHEQFKDQHLINACFAPHAPYTVSNQTFEKIQNKANQHHLNIHIHLHETEAEVEESKANYGLSPLQRLQQLELLNDSLMAVHMTQLSNEDIALCASTGLHIIHCPESNMKLASGFCPVSQCLDAGINLCLGTDSTASNNDLDMLSEMRTAALIAKGISKNASAVPARTALEMATINAAKALGMDHEIGSLTPGKSADITAINLNQLETLPTYHPESQLIYCCHRQQVTDVWVNGQQLLENSHLKTIDINQLKKEIQVWKHKISQHTASKN